MKTEKKTKHIKKIDFNNEIKSRDRVFVLFYASWCYFCQAFLPIFEEYAKNNKHECMSVIIDDEPGLCEEYAIEYYPTVLLLNKGKVHKRLDAEPGIGLSKKQLAEFTNNP